MPISNLEKFKTKRHLRKVFSGFCFMREIQPHKARFTWRDVASMYKIKFVCCRVHQRKRLLHNKRNLLGETFHYKLTKSLLTSTVCSDRV